MQLANIYHADANDVNAILAKKASKSGVSIGIPDGLMKSTEDKCESCLQYFPAIFVDSAKTVDNRVCYVDPKSMNEDEIAEYLMSLGYSDVRKNRHSARNRAIVNSFRNHGVSKLVV